MFQGLFKRAESTIDSVVSRLVARAMAAIPLAVALAFATAALTVKLVETYGSVTAYAIMAALFALFGLISFIVVGFPSQAGSETAQSAASSQADEKAAEKESDIDVSELLTPEVRAFLASTAPLALPTIARGVGRNLPLILLLALVGFVISRFAGGQSETSESGTEAAPETATADEPPAAAA